MADIVNDFGVTEQDVADVQAALRRVRAARELLDRLLVNGTQCDGSIERCERTIATAEVLIDELTK